MISKKMEDALNKQIGMEAFASSAYLAMASWCDTEGYKGCASFMYAQAEEERVHMLKIVAYVNEVGGHALVSTIKEPQNSFKSLKEMFEETLGHEQAVTKSINKMVDMALTAKDFASNNFLQWFVAEQVEEESQVNGILDLLRLAGKDGRSMLLADREIGRMRSQAAAGEAK
ncbi:MAG: ferritin [Candidatus Omnitrophica bacterium]|nr:ferritin [Candidatus Omnitrophota bacterium]